MSRPSTPSSSSIGPSVPAERLSVHDWQREAAAALDEGALGYLEGGAGDERALRETMAAFARIRFLPRMLAGIAEPELATTVIGTRI